MSQRIGVEVAANPGPGILHQLSGVIAREQGNILSIEIVEEKSPETVTYFEIDVPGTSPVPEPGTWVLLITGAGALAGVAAASPMSDLDADSLAHAEDLMAGAHATLADAGRLDLIEVA